MSGRYRKDNYYYYYYDYLCYYVIEFSYAIWSQLSIQVYLLSFTVIVFKQFCDVYNWLY